MTLDVREALTRAAHTPTGPTDYAALERSVLARRRRRVGLMAATAATAATVVAMAVAPFLTDTDRDRDRAEDASPPVTLVPSPRESDPVTARWVPNRLNVPAVEDGDLHRLTVTLPDGASFEVSAPVEAGLDRLTAHPFGAGAVPGASSRDFIFPPGGLFWFESVGSQERELRSTDGASVTLWNVDESEGGPLRYLVFEFGDWVLGVWDGAGGSQMSDAELETWADNLHGTTTSDGFLVLSATGPLDLSASTSGAVATLTLGEAVGPGLSVFDETCEEPVTDISPGFASLCRPEWGASVHVNDGGGTLVDLLETGLTVRPRP